MTTAQDFLSLLAGSVGFFAADSRSGFIGIAILGLILAAICWWGCSRFSHLWNLGYRIVLLHHVLCFLAATLTLGFTITFFALGYAKQASNTSVQLWEAQIKADAAWSKAVFTKAWRRVKDTGLEDFTNVPPPSNADSFIPLNKDGSIRLTATIYTKSALDHFVIHRPFLSKIMTAQPDIPQRLVDTDVKTYFATVHGMYPLSRAVALAAREIKAQLETQLPRVVSLFRTWEVILFFLVQLVPFGLVAIAAYTNLKITTAARGYRAIV
jgi:hypothetical protein